MDEIVELPALSGFFAGTVPVEKQTAGPQRPRKDKFLEGFEVFAFYPNTLTLKHPAA
jgi:hypothetical protein